MLQNAYLLAKIVADTAENEQHFAENSLKIGEPVKPEDDDGDVIANELAAHDGGGKSWDQSTEVHFVSEIWVNSFN